MFKILAFVTLFVVGALGTNIAPLGVVNPVQRCGGVGTPIQLRISNCEGRCQLIAGSRYDCEKDFIPAAAAPSLTLRVEICVLTGFCWNILQTELAGSSVQPGQIYTARYSIVPNDIFSGETLIFKASLFHTDNLLEEVCITAEIDML